MTLSSSPKMYSPRLTTKHELEQLLMKHGQKVAGYTRGGKVCADPLGGALGGFLSRLHI